MYRGDEAAVHAARLTEDLIHRLGSESVIPAGEARPGDLLLLVIVAHGRIRVVLGRRAWTIAPERWDRDVEALAEKLRALLSTSPLEQLVEAEAAGVITRRRRSPGTPPPPLVAKPETPPPVPQPEEGWPEAAASTEEGEERAFEPLPERRPEPAPSAPRRAERDVDLLEPEYGRAARRRLVRLAGSLVLVGGLAALILRWIVNGMVDLPQTAEPIDDPVDFTVFSPEQVAAGDAVLVQVFAHLPTQAGAARALASEFDTAAGARAISSLALPIARGSRLDFELRMPGVDVDEHCQTLVWRGRPASVQFGVSVPADMKPGTKIATVVVSQDSIPVGHVKFQLKIVAELPPADERTPQPVGDDARPYERAFVSYAHEDRPEVLRRVQALRLKRLSHLAIFQDLLDIEPGERWRRELYREIDLCDVLLLFWSTAARDSEWVRREVGYALARKAGELDPPEILPLVIEIPPAPPWPELADYQFDDVVARLIAADES
jgi:hypothetical protein